jgi:hypothetical protein
MREVQIAFGIPELEFWQTNNSGAIDKGRYGQRSCDWRRRMTAGRHLQRHYGDEYQGTKHGALYEIVFYSFRWVISFSLVNSSLGEL